MMSQGRKRELVEAVRPRYLKAPRREKNSIIDEFITITGHHRKYAIRLLKRGYPVRKKKKSGRKIADMLSIEERLAEVADQTVPGYFLYKLLKGSAEYICMQWWILSVIVHNDVLPFYKSEGVTVKAMLKGNGREFCAKDSFPYEIYLALNDMEYRKTKVRKSKYRRFRGEIQAHSA